MLRSAALKPMLLQVHIDSDNAKRFQIWVKLVTRFHIQVILIREVSYGFEDLLNLYVQDGEIFNCFDRCIEYKAMSSGPLSLRCGATWCRVYFE